MTADPQARPRWRTHPLARRLPLLVLAAVGLWLWEATGTPERELVWQLDGPGWSDVRALDFQVASPSGEILKREERFFSSAPPPELTLEADLPAGTFHARIFVKHEGREPRTRLLETLQLGDERYVVRRLRLPVNR